MRVSVRTMRTCVCASPTATSASRTSALGLRAIAAPFGGWLMIAAVRADLERTRVGINWREATLPTLV
jgi:hypothetical protein